MHFLSNSNHWVTESEFVSSTGVISKANGESKVEIFKDYISNKSYVFIDGKALKNDYEIHKVSENRLTYRSKNPDLGVQTGTFDIDRNTIYSRFVVERTKLHGFEIIVRKGDECFANGALYSDDELINTWSAIMTKSEKREIKVRCALLEDKNDWLYLVKEVEPLFGKMIGVPEFEEEINIAVQKGLVFCAENLSSNRIAGVIVIDKEENSIEWLAVSDHLKRQGIGRILVEYAINELDSKRDMKVQTFSKGVEAGTPARNLYQAFGFEDHKNMGKNPAGIETVLMIKKQKNVLI